MPSQRAGATTLLSLLCSWLQYTPLYPSPSTSTASFCSLLGTTSHKRNQNPPCWLVPTMEESPKHVAYFAVKVLSQHRGIKRHIDPWNLGHRWYVCDSCPAVGLWVSVLRERRHQVNPTGKHVEIMLCAICITCNPIELTAGDMSVENRFITCSCLIAMVSCHCHWGSGQYPAGCGYFLVQQSAPAWDVLVTWSS